MKSDIIQIVETEGLYYLRIDYDEADAASAVGHVFWLDGLGRPGEMSAQVLATNDPLRVMWASPSGALWVAGASGSIATTAAVTWPAPAAGIDFRALGLSPKWTATELPRVRATGLRANVTALWGIDDATVFAGTYGGHVYRWDGTSWAQVFEGNGTVRAFGGSRDDVYALGTGATIVHFDGSAWRRLDVPGPPNGHEGFNALVRRPDGSVWISGNGQSGRLLEGSSRGLREIGRYAIPLIDMAALGDRVLFATGNGAAELIDGDVKMVKTTFLTATISPGKGRLFFIEPTQARPSFIQHDPRKLDLPWSRLAY
jgi:hypothetical protein